MPKTKIKNRPSEPLSLEPLSSAAILPANANSSASNGSAGIYTNFPINLRKITDKYEKIPQKARYKFPYRF